MPKPMPIDKDPHSLPGGARRVEPSGPCDAKPQPASADGAARSAQDSASSHRGRKKARASDRSDGSLERALGMPKPLRAKFARMGVQSVADLLFLRPMRYLDQSRPTPARDMQDGAHCVAEGIAIMRKAVGPRGAEFRFVDRADDVFAGIWFNLHPAVESKLEQPGPKRLFGVAKRNEYSGLMTLQQPAVGSLSDPLPDSLTAIYPATANLSQRDIAKYCRMALARCEIEEYLRPEDLIRLNLIGLPQALRELHRPPLGYSPEQAADGRYPALRRLKFHELFAQQLSMLWAKTLRLRNKAPKLQGTGELQARFARALGFELTGAQKRAIGEIQGSMASGHPMNRLLQGDVGSGKTAVAAIACLTAIESGAQAALMAPTEVLAEQHALRFESWLKPLGVAVDLLVSSVKPKEKAAILKRVASGETQLIIGTHAILQDSVAFDRLGLVVIDEQHKFGVDQRLKLNDKGEGAHRLMMTATPIPRSLCMTYLADLDVSVIDELPPGRSPISTLLVKSSRKDEVLGFVEAAIRRGEQAYWVCPLIGESEALEDVAAATAVFEAIRARFEGVCETGLAHGRLKWAEKNEVMSGFSSGKIGILVATTVIEVGVDVPNASCMVIENAERLGLAQLHQLRGRVGRGANKSHCVLMFGPKLTKVAVRRLKIMEKTSDGFLIAQEDLRIRGPGELLGTKQSGEAMYRFADLNEDQDLQRAARELAEKLIRTESEETILALIEKSIDKFRFMTA